MGVPSDDPPPYTPTDPATGSSTHRPAAPPQQPPQPQWRPPAHPSAPRNDYSHIKQDQGPNLPWKYPPRYYCSKCKNTGYKLKNGKTCKDCWKTFARQPNVQYQTVPSNDPGFRIPFTDHYLHDDLTVSRGYTTTPVMMPQGIPQWMPQPIPQGMPPMGMPPMPPPPPMGYGVMPPPAPRIVRPGDPSIGGFQCGACRGTGVVTAMLFDEDLCPVCHGVGRVFKN